MDSIILSDIQNINIIEDNSSFIYSNIEPFFGNLFNNQNEEKTLKSNSLLRKKNAESSRQARQRKKLEFEKLTKENQFLKQKFQFLEKIINQHICKECKSKIIPFLKPTIESNTSNYNFKKKFFFFTTAITIILLYLLNNSNITINHLRKLRTQYERDILLSSDYILNSTISSHAMYIRYGDYYSIIHHKPFLGSKKYSIENKIRNLNEYNLKEDINPEKCSNCVIRLNENCLKVIGPFKFSLYLTPGYISTPFYNKTYENFTINGNKYYTYYEFEMTGYSINKAIIQDK
jgi:hypothetical protein